MAPLPPTIVGTPMDLVARSRPQSRGAAAEIGGTGLGTLGGAVSDLSTNPAAIVGIVIGVLLLITAIWIGVRNRSKRAKVKAEGDAAAAGANLSAPPPPGKQDIGTSQYHPGPVGKQVYASGGKLSK
ncbi:hypothetical protein C8F04DRAFT_1174733 [Mycena alexandri]|uniref:Uncharacterized protein n=1 Tax=Mycena alexandri TaxID=1745969 RepID=A0AAD6TD79_9AGAR|nr:hypothetical protein C8F04DRAFT_1174733 [Mycena alexandri]